MNFSDHVPTADQNRIVRALRDIKRFGDRFQTETAEFLTNTKIVIHLDMASEVGGSGSVQLYSARAAKRAVRKSELTVKEAAGFVRLNIARETIDGGGQRGIEGTFVHEGKHARDFALMLSTFSLGVKEKVFDPTAFQREYSAHLTAAFYLMRRRGEYTDEGVSLGILSREDGMVYKKGIRARLRDNYGLTEKNPGPRLSECSRPNIKLPREKWFGLF